MPPSLSQSSREQFQLKCIASAPFRMAAPFKEKQYDWSGRKYPPPQATSTSPGGRD